MKYNVCVEMLNIIEVEAVSEDDAINRVKYGLVAQKQIREADPVRFSIVEEINLKESTK